MNRVFLFLFLIQLTTTAVAQKVNCVLQGLKDPISFTVPSKAGKLPQVDFPYPVKVTLFSLRSKNLFLMAMDNDDSSRPRLMISAQAHKDKETYKGQFMTDYGGNQIQIDNGRASCKVK